MPSGPRLARETSRKVCPALLVMPWRAPWSRGSQKSANGVCRVRRMGARARLTDAPAPRAWRGVSSLVTGLTTPLTVACAVLAVSPDFDNLFHTHRTYSHSLGAAAIVWMLAAVVAWRLRLSVVRVATICAAAYASHVLLDWLGRDDSAAGGLMVLWPMSARYYRSGLNLFLELGAASAFRAHVVAESQRARLDPRGPHPRPAVPHRHDASVERLACARTGNVLTGAITAWSRQRSRRLDNRRPDQ